MALTRAVDLMKEVAHKLLPPEPLSHSDYADKYFYVTKGGSLGKWRTRPYQKEILDSWSDVRVWRTSIMKSARVGLTTMLNIDECYRLHYDPCSTCTVQPTTGYAEKYSRDTFNKMLETIPVLKELFSECKWRDGTNSILEKYVNGASLSFLGANSPNGFRGWTYKVARADEVDGYPTMGAGNEGDQIQLLVNRTIDYWDRLFIECSTPTVEDFSRIEKSFALGDQRRRHLPCPHCGHMQYLVWKEPEGPGGFWWERGKPETTVYICNSCEKPIKYGDRNEMDRHGVWQATAPSNVGPDSREHRSYHIWAAYSYQPNATWGHIVDSYEKSAADPLQYQTWVNTWLGEVYKENAHSRVTAASLMDLRDGRAVSELSEGCLMLTCGVDVQDDRLECCVYGWGTENIPKGEPLPEPEGWLVDHLVIYGRYHDQAMWRELDKLLDFEWEHPEGGKVGLSAMAVDSGDGEHAPYVYEYANTRARKNVIATKGTPIEGKPPIGKGSATSYDWKGRPSKTAASVYLVGTDVIKTRLTSRLRADPKTLHLHSDVTEEFCQQLASERLILRQGKRRWIRKPGMKAEALDATVYAYAAMQFTVRKYNPLTVWELFKKRATGVELPRKERRTFNVLGGSEL